MKVAICLSGQTRDIENTLENIKTSWFGFNDLDFFIHTWHYNKNKSYRVDTPSDIIESKIDYIIQKLSPKLIVIESEKIFIKFIKIQ